MTVREIAVVMLAGAAMWVSGVLFTLWAVRL